MPDIQCPSCKATVPGTAKFCPECGVPVELRTVRPSGNKPAKKKFKKKRPGLKALLLRFCEMIGQAVVNALDWLLIVPVMPFLIIQLSHWIGTIAAWIAVVLTAAFGIMITKPMPVPMGNTPHKAKVAAVMMFLAAGGAYYFGLQTEELADLKERDIPAYLEKLREYKGDDKWLAAVKELTPGDYAETVRKYEAAKVKEAQRQEEQKAADERRKAEEDMARYKAQVLARLKSRAVENPANGISIGQYDFGDRWSLKPSGGVLRCELGPVANGAPRPIVLLDAENKTYALNGAALGTGKYEDGRTLAIDGNTQTIRDLIPIGIAMCDEISTTQCGTDTFAYGQAMAAVERQLKNPGSADFVASEIQVAMESCGVWLIKSAVDAENSVGAVIRTHFAAEVRRLPNGQWDTKVFLKE